MTKTAAEFGTVTHNGATITLTQTAYIDNYGTDGAVRYYAHGVDADGNEYRVAWDTTAAWDSVEEAFRADPENAPANDDESLACDWENPAEVVEF